jgi:hypothetical protein
MRGLAGAGLAALVLSTAACGSSGSSIAGAPGGDAARLVPRDALAFVSVNADLDTKQWQRLDDLTRGLPARERIVRMVHEALAKEQLDFDRDVRPGIGPELDLAVLGVENGEPEVVALAQPEDEAKLKSLAYLYSTGSDHYTVEEVGDWSVVADSRKAFEDVRAARDGRSLSDQPPFQAASSQLGDDAIARVYVDGAAARRLPPDLRSFVRAAGNPAWAAASLVVEDEALRLRVAVDRTGTTPAPYAPRLLREVPSGASLAISFRGLDQLVSRLGAEPAFASLANDVRDYLGIGVGELAPLLRGEGVIYARGAGILPVLALELESRHPAEAARVLRRVAARLGSRAGALLTLSVTTRPGRVILATSPQAAAGLGASGPKLVDDQRFKDALANADVPDQVTGLVYADVGELLPLIEAAAAAFGKPFSRDTETNLQRLRTLVAYGTADSSAARFEAWLQLGGH